MVKILSIVTAILLISLPAVAQDAAAEMDGAFAQAEAAMCKTQNGEFIVQLQERIKGKMRGIEIVHGYFTTQPERLYFHWQPGGLNEGLQASYDEKRDGKGKFMALEAGIAGLVGIRTYKVDSIIIEKTNPHRLYMPDYNLNDLIAMVKGHVINGKKAGMTVMKEKSEVFGMPVTVYTAKIPGGQPYDLVKIGFDENSKLPYLIQLYEKGVLCADYKFRLLKTNIEVDPAVFTLKKL